MTDVGDIVNALHGKRYRYTDEVALHGGLALALDNAEIAYEREVPVTGGRIDFVIDRVGVEVKVKGSPEAVAAQVDRYSLDDRFDEFLIVTTKPIHRAASGATSNGKRVRVLTIGGLGL